MRSRSRRLSLRSLLTRIYSRSRDGRRQSWTPAMSTDWSTSSCTGTYSGCSKGAVIGSHDMQIVPKALFNIVLASANAYILTGYLNG